MQNCVFCRIVEGNLPAEKVYEDERIVAFLDIHPANDGHTLVVTKQHYENIFEIPEEELGYVHSQTKKIAQAIKSAVNADGINIDQSNGQAARQEVPHLHVHIIPRFNNDNIMVGLMRRGNDDAEFLRTVAEKIREAI